MKIAGRIIEIPDIVSLLNNAEVKYPDELLNSNIFTYMKVPNTTTKVKNYICFNYNSKISQRNDTFKNVIIDIACVCHDDESNILTPHGNRHDILAGVIIDSFNLSNFLGYQLELVSDTESILEKNYLVRTLQFRNLTLNSFENGVRVNGIR